MRIRVRSVIPVLALVVLLAPAWLPGSAWAEEAFGPAGRPAAGSELVNSACPPVRVYDYDGTERDWSWLVATFGNVWVEPGDGSACLAELRAIHDDATLNVRLEDAAGAPVNGTAVVFHWPDAPLLPPELVGCYDRGVYGTTGEGSKSSGFQIESAPGEVGFGMGSGAFYCPPNGGPHTVWVGVEGSDCVHGLGMLCWTNHDHVNPTFVLGGGSLPSPSLLPISNGDHDGNYLVDWSAVEGATSYRLEEDSSSSFASPTVRYQGSATQYQIGGQAAGTWYYRVRASGAAGDSPWSNTQSTTVNQPPPEAPILYSISNGDHDGDYLVDWSAVGGATSYRLEEDSSSSFASPILRYQGSATQYQIGGQAAGTWYYRVRASGAAGDSPWSSTQSTTVNQSPPDAPILYPIGNADGDGDYLVDWSEVTDATKYRLEEDDNPGFSSPIVRYLGYNLQYHVTGRPPGMRYYRVRTSNAAGFSPWSNTESVLTGPMPPVAPVLYAIDNDDGNGSYLVDWSEVADATKYRLEEDDNPGFSSPIVRYLGYNTQYQVTGRLPGTLYYRVRTSNVAGYGPWSNTRSVIVEPGSVWARPVRVRL